MQSFHKHTGLVVSLDRANVDTDQIIPKQFLKRIERTGFGEFLFYDWRYLTDGSPNSDFILNHPRYQGASILVAAKNFGCGSSREHAPWALAEYGFRVIIARHLCEQLLQEWTAANHTAGADSDGDYAAHARKRRLQVNRRSRSTDDC